jgi:hypothetical protein
LRRGVERERRGVEREANAFCSAAGRPDFARPYQPVDKSHSRQQSDFINGLLRLTVSQSVDQFIFS